jgi:rubrerythrin
MPVGLCLRAKQQRVSRIYLSFAEDLAERYPDSAKIFEEMAEGEKDHRHQLLEIYEQRFGPNLPPIRREDVKGFLRRRPIWLTQNLPLDVIRKEAETMEFQAQRFYIKAAEHTTDIGVRKLLGDLAEAEKSHENLAAKLTDQILTPNVRAEEEKTRHRMFVLAIRAARSRGVDGWLCIDTGPTLCGSLCDASELADFPCRVGSINRCWNQHGICGSIVR